MSEQSLRIGTRKSAMALAQTGRIARRLRSEGADLDVTIFKFETPGDQDQTSKLARHGGKQRLADAREAPAVPNGPCNSPIAAHAVLSGHGMTLSASALDEQISRMIETSRCSPEDH